MIVALAACLVPINALPHDGSNRKTDPEATSIRAFCTQHRHGKVYTQTELFFGLSKPGGGVVSEADFRRFMETDVTPRFPEGLTVVNAGGQFKDSSGAIIREDAKLVILHYPYSRTNNDAVEAIRTAYKTAFQQESVLRVDKLSCVSY